MDSVPPASPSPAASARTGRKMRFRDVLLPVGLSLGALAIILWLTYEPGSFATAAASFRPGFLLLAFVALACQIGAGGLRLRHVSHAALSARAGLRGQLTWDFMSAVTPSAMGGAPFAGFFIAKENHLPYGQVTAVMVFTMVMDQIWYAAIIVVMYVSAIWVPVFPTSLGPVGIGTVAAYLGGIMLWFGFFGYATLVRPELIEKAAALVVRLKWLRRFEPTVRAETGKLRAQAKTLRGQPFRFYLVTAGYTVVYWLGRYFVALFVAMAFVEDFRHILYVLRTAGLGLAGLIMPTPGGSGGIEALFLLYLAPLLPGGLGGPVLLIWRLLSYHLILVVGSFVAGGALRMMLRGEGPPDPVAADAPSPNPIEEVAAPA